MPPLAGVLGKKVGMTQVFEDDGRISPVTVIQIGPCAVLQVRDAKRDGYRFSSIVLGIVRSVPFQMRAAS